MEDTYFCNDFILVMPCVDGCSRASPISMDPSEVPGLSRLPMKHMLLFVGPIIGIGAVNVVLLAIDVLGGLLDLYGMWLGLDILAEEDDNSIGGPETRT